MLCRLEQRVHAQRDRGLTPKLAELARRCGRRARSGAKVGATVCGVLHPSERRLVLLGGDVSVELCTLVAVRRSDGHDGRDGRRAAVVARAVDQAGGVGHREAADAGCSGDVGFGDGASLEHLRRREQAAARRQLSQVGRGWGGGMAVQGIGYTGSMA